MHICQYIYNVCRSACSNCAELRQPSTSASTITLYVKVRVLTVQSCVSHAHLPVYLHCMSKCVLRLCRAASEMHICQHNYIVRQSACSYCAELRQPSTSASTLTLYVEVRVPTEQSCGSHATHCHDRILC